MWDFTVGFFIRLYVIFEGDERDGLVWMGLVEGGWQYIVSQALILRH